MPSINKFFKSLKHALNGLKTAWQTQNNFRWHVLAFVVVLLVGYWVRLERLEWASVLLVSALVIMSELINTIIEKLVDLAKPSVHIYAKMVKDVSASVTLIVAVTAVIIGLIIFLPHLIP